MTFTLLPAVDVAGGRVARTVRDEARVASDTGDPREAARAFQAAGATWIHVVDLDAALGHGSNTDLLAALIGELDVAVELSGGIHDDASLQWALSTGCARVNVATAALADPAWCARAIAQHGERIAVSLDVRVVAGADGSTQHRLTARGAMTDSGDLWEALAWLDRACCARYVVTDVSRDGLLRGPNVELYRAVARATPARLIASGGVSSLEDLVVLTEVADDTALEGAIVGRALLAGRFSLPEALAAVGATAPRRGC